MFPEVPVAFGPVGDLFERAGLDPAGPPLGFAAARDEPARSSTRRCFDTAGMLMSKGSASSVTEHSPGGQTGEDGPAGRVGEGGEGGAQLVGGHVY